MVTTIVNGILFMIKIVNNQLYNWILFMIKIVNSQLYNWIEGMWMNDCLVT